MPHYMLPQPFQCDYTDGRTLTRHEEFMDHDVSSGKVTAVEESRIELNAEIRITDCETDRRDRTR